MAWLQNIARGCYGGKQGRKLQIVHDHFSLKIRRIDKFNAQNDHISIVVIVLRGRETKSGV